MKRVAIVIIPLLLVSLSGCRKKEAPEQEGQEISKNPLKAMSQLGEAARKAAEAAKEAEQMKPVDPVKFDQLIPLLPDAPTGWKAEEARGETTSAAGYKVSNVQRSYSKGDGQHLEVAILDGAFNPVVYASVTMIAQFSHESTEGYEKGVTIDGCPGVEAFRKSGDHSELTAVVAKRYVVSVKGDGVKPDFIRGVWKSIDRGTLASLK